MSDEILDKLNELQTAMEAGHKKLETAIEGLRSEMRSEFAALRREANERQELYQQYFRALGADRGNLRHAS